ncbi:hypothetical protein OS493_018473 [Desmophyllum pertusum]|uniref:Uncharacterized protein n=1 Tax=Desmophyllum pertusum TaxID=174260 RepID=A0A9X0A0V6_9CNID|nr:hypothetical protein OS493_018473 [Desmophyllum pertusum]
MYQLFLEKNEPEVWKGRSEGLRSMQQNVRPEGNIPKPWISLTLYSNIFNDDFNLGFGRPRSDTCAKCDELHIAIQAANGAKKLQKRGRKKNTTTRQSRATLPSPMTRRRPSIAGGVKNG